MPGRNLRLPTLNYVCVACRCTSDLDLFPKENGEPAGTSTWATFRIAMTTKFEKDGDKGRSCFLNVKVIGEAAVAHAKQHVRKGEALVIQGRLDDDVWNDRETGNERRATKLIAERIQPLAWPEEAGEQGSSTSTPPAQYNAGSSYRVPTPQPQNDDSDVPF